MKMVAFKNHPEEENTADTFADRAEAYYQKRPQLLSLLQDLYHAYLSLADRYCQTLSKHHHPQESSLFSTSSNYRDEENDSAIKTQVDDSDAESSLSYQQQQPPPPPELDLDGLVTEVVMKSVTHDILAHELGVAEESSLRKIELQRSLLEVLESERLILLNENARLGYRVTAMVDENRGLAAESLFMKRKAGELARCLLKMREERRDCMFIRKIEDLQRQIYGLEKRNKEYYEQLVRRDNQPKQQKKHEEKDEKKNKNGGEVTLEDCFFHVDEEAAHAAGGMKRDVHCGCGGGNGNGRRFSKWWGRVKNFDLFMCGPQTNFTC